MLVKIFLLFLLVGTGLCQFFTNGRYGKRSQTSFADDQVAGVAYDGSSAMDSLPKLSCVYTGYQALYTCHRTASDGSPLTSYGRK